MMTLFSSKEYQQCLTMFLDGSTFNSTINTQAAQEHCIKKPLTMYQNQMKKVMLVDLHKPNYIILKTRPNLFTGPYQGWAGFSRLERSQMEVSYTHEASHSKETGIRKSQTSEKKLCQQIGNWKEKKIVFSYLWIIASHYQCINSYGD